MFAEGELSPEATLRRYRIVQDLGSRAITHGVDPFSLPIILAVSAGCGAPLSPAAAVRARSAPLPRPRARAATRLWRAKPRRSLRALLHAARRRRRGPTQESAPPHPPHPTFFASPSCAPSPHKPHSRCAAPRTRRPQAPASLSTPKTREPPGATNTERLEGTNFSGRTAQKACSWPISGAPWRPAGPWWGTGGTALGWTSLRGASPVPAGLTSGSGRLNALHLAKPFRPCLLSNILRPSAQG
jgi:hypothetical protein